MALLDNLYLDLGADISAAATSVPTSVSYWAPYLAPGIVDLNPWEFQGRPTVYRHIAAFNDCPPPLRRPEDEECDDPTQIRNAEGECIPADPNTGLGDLIPEDLTPPLVFLAPKREVDERPFSPDLQLTTAHYGITRTKTVIDEHLFYELPPQDYLGSGDNNWEFSSTDQPFRGPYRAIIRNRLGFLGMNERRLYKEIDFFRYCIGSFWTTSALTSESLRMAYNVDSSEYYTPGQLFRVASHYKSVRDTYHDSFTPFYILPTSPEEGLGANIRVAVRERGQLPIYRERFTVHANTNIYPRSRLNNDFENYITLQSDVPFATLDSAEEGYTWYEPKDFLYGIQPIFNPREAEATKYSDLSFRDYPVFDENSTSITWLDNFQDALRLTGQGAPGADDPESPDYNPEFGHHELNLQYTDIVHDSKLPYFKSEVQHLDYSSNLTVEFDVHTTYIPETYKRASNINEYLMPNLYRIYSSRADPAPEEEEPCSIDDRVSKFTSRNIEEFPRARKDQLQKFPMAVNIKFQTSQGSRLAQTLRRTGIDKYLLDYLSNLAFPDRDRARDFFTEIIDQEVMGSGELDPAVEESVIDQILRPLSKSSMTSRDEATDPTGTINDDAAYCQPRIHFDFYKWLTEFVQPGRINELEFPLRVFPRNNILNQRDGAATIFEFFINRGILIGVLDQMAADKTRTYEELILGKKAHSETIAYKISKHEYITNAAGEEIINWEPMQEFYFADSDQIQEIDFIDTQVKYGRTYQYRIWAYNVIFGNYYDYLYHPNLTDAGTGTSFNTEHPDLGQNGIGLVDTFTKPYICLMEVPYLERMVHIKDKLPVFPSVDIVPLKGYDDRVKINLTANTGEYLLTPTAIYPTEQLASDPRLYASQPLRSDGKLLFKSDDLPKFYEWFRTCVPPMSYTDFSNASEPTTAWGSIPSDAGLSSGATVYHSVEPNKKYYYTFRALDASGRSIPTTVYEIMLVSYADGIYFHMKEYEFPKKRVILSKRFRQNLQITPADIHRVPSSLAAFVEPGDHDLRLALQLLPVRETRDRIPTESGEVATKAVNLRLGSPQIPEELSIWDKKIKFRIRSLKSGKSVDLNATFRQTVIEKTEVVGPPVQPPATVCDPDRVDQTSSRPTVNIEIDRGDCPEGYTWDGSICVPPPEPSPNVGPCPMCHSRRGIDSECQPDVQCPVGYELVPSADIYGDGANHGVGKCICIPVCPIGYSFVGLEEFLRLLREAGGNYSRVVGCIRIGDPDKKTGKPMGGPGIPGASPKGEY